MISDASNQATQSSFEGLACYCTRRFAIVFTVRHLFLKKKKVHQTMVGIHIGHMTSICNKDLGKNIRYTSQAEVCNNKLMILFVLDFFLFSFLFPFII